MHSLIVYGVMLAVAVGLWQYPTLLMVYAIMLILLRWLERGGPGTQPASKASREPEHGTTDFSQRTQ
jgi:hypothetical protein